MAGKKEILNLTESRGKLIEKLFGRLESQVKESQRHLLQTVLDDFLDGMEKDESGNLKNTLGNKRRLQMFDNVFKKFANSHGLEIVKGLSDGVGQLINFNKKYYGVFEKPAKLGPIHDNVKATIGAWLGLTERGAIEKNGYLDTLINDPGVKNSIRNIASKGVISQAGYFETKKNLQNYIQGNKDTAGAMERYHRNFSYDLYSKADRTAAGVYADKLKFNYAIYEGGLIKTSRKFCKERNGKVFSREEIAKFNPTEAKPPGYDPFTDAGGYSCRHHYNFVPDAVAFALRPELKKTLNE